MTLIIDRGRLLYKLNTYSSAFHSILYTSSRHFEPEYRASQNTGCPRIQGVTDHGVL